MANSFCKYLPQDESPKMREEKEKKNTKSFITEVVPIIAPPKKKNAETQKPQKITNLDNIFSIHDIVLRTLRNRFENLDALKKRLSQLEWIRDNSEDDILQQKEARQKIFKLKKTIHVIEDQKEIKKYEEMTKPILEKYNQIRPSFKSFVFVDDGKNSGEDEKIELSNKFLSIARKFVDIGVRNVKPKRLICKECNLSDFKDTENGVYSCSGCGACVEIIDDSHSYKDIDRINMSSRYTYTRRGHFKEAMDKFQGKQNTTISKDVYDMLYAQNEKYGITIDRLTKDHIMLFLQENNYPRHYEDLTLIWCTMTKQEPPDISEYESDALIMFDQQEAIYDKIKDPTRTNSLNVNFKLYKILELLGYPCRHQDFYILKTREKISDHDDKWKEICQILGWVFIPTL